jgi:integrase
VPDAVQRPIRTWTPDEAARFLEALPGDGMGILLRLLLVTGMRRGEALAVRWTHVNLTAAQLRIEASRVAIGARVVEGRPKSRAGIRTVHLDVDTTSHLRAWKALQSGDAGYVCTDETGRPIVPWRASAAFQKQCQQLGMPKVRLHDLRHTSATLGLACGESLKEVSQRLGHADIGITAGVYADVQPATAKASAERRAALMGAGSPITAVRPVAS